MARKEQLEAVRTLAEWVIQVLHVLVILLALAPLVPGVIARVQASVQQRRESLVRPIGNGQR